MKMESSTQANSLISSLPEIISKIMEFLPTPDLESTSLVNSTWERESLRHLLIRNPVDVHLHNGSDSIDLAPIVNLPPTQLNLIICQSNQLNNAEILFSKVELFTAANFNTVTKLSIALPVDNSLRHVASRFVKIYESLKNLTSLQFQPVVSDFKSFFSTDKNWADVLPDGINSQKLTTLTIDMSKLYLEVLAGRGHNVDSLTTRILTVFRHVQRLKLIETPGGLVKREGLNLPHLKSISLLRIFEISGFLPPRSLFAFKAPLTTSFANVARLEFNVLCEDIPNGGDLLHLLAPQLEHVCISSVENVSPNEPTDKFVTIPILPRLKVFEILRQQVLSRKYDKNWFRPDLHINFETGSDEVKLVYAKQFPVLQRLIVRVVQGKSIPMWREDMDHFPDDHEHFEVTMLFLDETFLAEGVTPCETVKNLDISFPSGGNVGMMRSCWCTWICQCWGSQEKGAHFYSRISTVFPNVDYHVVEKGKEVERIAGLEKLKMFKKFKIL